jgi:hypothetical protein
MFSYRFTTHRRNFSNFRDRLYLTLGEIGQDAHVVDEARKGFFDGGDTRATPPVA